MARDPHEVEPLMVGDTAVTFDSPLLSDTAREEHGLYADTILYADTTIASWQRAVFRVR